MIFGGRMPKGWNFNGLAGRIYNELYHKGIIPPGCLRDAEAFGLLAMAFGGGMPSQQDVDWGTQQIVNHFLFSHQNELSEKTKNQNSVSMEKINSDGIEQ